MTGQVTRPLTVEESDNSVIVRPCTEISFNAADFTVAATGQQATISIDATGVGADLTDTYVGYGDSSNLMTGSTLFTYDDTAGSERLTLKTSGGGNLVTLESTVAISTDNAPELDFYRSAGDATAGSGLGQINWTGKIASSDAVFGRFEFATEGTTSGRLELMIRKDASTEVRVLKATTLSSVGQGIIWNPESNDLDFKWKGTAVSEVLYVDASAGAVGVGGTPDATVERLHIKGASTDLYTMAIETDASAGGADNTSPDLLFYKNRTDASGSQFIARVDMMGHDLAGATQIYNIIAGQAGTQTAGAEDGNLYFWCVNGGSTVDLNEAQLIIENDTVVINRDNNEIDFRVETSGNQSTFCVDAGTDRVGVFTADPMVPFSVVCQDSRGSTSKRGGIGVTASADPSGLEGVQIYASGSDNNIVGVVHFVESENSGVYDYGFSIMGDGAGTNNRLDFRYHEGSETGVVFMRTARATGYVTFNPEQTSTGDFAVLGQTDTIAYFDANRDSVGFGRAPGTTGEVERVDIAGTGTSAPIVRISSTDDGSAASPILELYRDSASPAGAPTYDYVGQITMTGENSVGGTHTYCAISGRIVTATDGNEASQLQFASSTNGSLARRMQLEYGSVVINPEKNNETHLIMYDDSSNILIKADCAYENVGIGGSPVSGGPVLQVFGAASFLRTVVNWTAAGAISAAQAYGYTHVGNHSGGSAIQVALPDAVAGMHLEMILVNTGDISLKPASGDTLNGLAADAALTLSTQWANFRVVSFLDNYWSVTSSTFSS